MSYYNTKIKVYNDDTYKVTYCNYKIFNDVKIKNTNSYIKKNKRKYKNYDERNIKRSVKRAKERIYDIVYLNKWDYFCTFTFNPKDVNSYSKKDVMKIVSKWFNKQKKDNGMLYILVPEFHKSKRIHIHALVKDGNLLLSNSGKTDNVGNIIYNINSWHYGFSTAISVYGSPSQLAHYITKYISKDICKIFGKYYWSSHGLLRDVLTLYTDTNYLNVEAPEYTIPGVNDISLKYQIVSDGLKK